MTEPIIQIRNVTKRFGAMVAVDNVSLDIKAGEFFVMLGPSGCGKTTLLRMIAGFEVPTEGQILIDGQDMAGVPPNKRPVNMVFQSYAVFPHMDVMDNVAYGLRIAGVPKTERRERAEEALALVKLDGLGTRMPDNGNVSRWRGRSSCVPKCFCSMSRCRRSMQNCVRRCNSN
jgi:ABC-type Fe3+/spermidine/putrescine transport system ATPase subunit